MSGVPHPVTVTFEAEKHRIDDQAERDQQRLLAEVDVEERQQWVALSAIVMLLVSVALVLALKSAIS